MAEISEYAKLINEQSALVSSVGKIFRNFKKDPSNRKTESYLRTRLETLSQLYTEFRTTHRQLIRNSNHEEVKTGYIAVEMDDKFECTYTEAAAAIRHELMQLEVRHVQPPPQSDGRQANTESTTIDELTLPEIKLPTFSGNHIEWPAFKEIYLSRVHNSTRLTNLQRFYYLKEALVEEAAKDIEHITVLGQNYQSAWDMLNKTYDNPRILFTHYMQVFDELPVVERNDALSLKRFTQACRSCVESIGKLGINIPEQNQIFVYYMQKKLHVDLRKDWDYYTRKSSTIPTFTEICAMLDEQYQMIITSSLPSVKENGMNKPDKKTVNSTQLTRKPSLCALCTNGDHPVRECSEFLKKTVEQRRLTVVQLNLCFNCLGYNHKSSTCSSKRNCSTCGRRHHTLIHSEETDSSTTDQSTEVLHTSLHVRKTVNRPQERGVVLLPTAIVGVRADNGQILQFRAFLDQGSQASFVTERAAQLLGLKRHSGCVDITGLAGALLGTGKSMVDLEIVSRIKPNCQHKVNAYILPKISNSMPNDRISTEHCHHLKNLKLADPKFHEPSRIDLLLGSDVYDECLLGDVKRGAAGMPIAQDTTLGYIISGKTDATASVSKEAVAFYAQTELESLLRKFWEAEELVDNTDTVDEESWAEQFYAETVTRKPDGKYLVRLPLLSQRNLAHTIGSSKAIALRRFLQLERRLATDTILKASYQATIDEYVKLGQMHQVLTPEEDHRVTHEGVTHFTSCYLPHHAIIKESSTTTKVRVVFDASAKTSNGKSLNDILAIGPTLQPDLAAVILNWRQLKFAMVADIEKMYRRIDVRTEDAQYQRILWRHSAKEPVQEYFCSTVMFGTASAPYTAIRTIHQLAADEAAHFPDAAKAVKQQMYVDDILSGGDSVAEACTLQQQLIRMLNSASFVLRKWSSNDARLLSSIPAEHQEVERTLQFNTGTIKTLGLHWNPNTDSFQFQLNFCIAAQTITKRSILSVIARLFDPLGWLNPVIVRAKILLQDLWMLKIGWDTSVPINVQRDWKQFIENLPLISDIRIPRWIHTTTGNQNRELHIFCDASMHSYSAVAYIRVQSTESEYFVHLLIAKSKITPIKPKLTIPRAELCAATLAVKLLNFLLEKCHLQFEASQISMWSDSMITLCWIQGVSTQWKIFVSNRIENILKSTTPSQWHHIRSEDNPADCSSRGIKPNQLLAHPLWWTGPPWLSMSRKHWPQTISDYHSETMMVNDEKRSVMTHNVQLNDAVIMEILTRFSSLNKLIRCYAYIRRFVDNCRLTDLQRNKSPLGLDELRAAFLSILQEVQKQAFPLEYHALSKNQSVTNGSRLLSLNPLWDNEERVIRVGGRLRNSLLRKDEKHPYILPKRHKLTELVIESSHRATLHGGVALTLNHIRNRFWIIDGRNAVRTSIHRCIICYKHKPISQEQCMGNLPAQRVRPARPFTSTGVDYAGPINILPSKGRGRISVKGYIAIFICLSTKAIHLEAVGDLSAQAFIGALHRFIGRRGLCHDIFSDCGTNFVGADKKLRANKHTYKKHITDNIVPFLTDNGIKWHFIPPSAPHFGGLWEAGVKSMKYHFRRTIGERKLTFEELSTVLAQIESCLNSRPLCPLSNDTEELAVLTPGHFLIGESLLAPPVPEIKEWQLTDRWHFCQFVSQQFWRQWSKEYLARLQSRPKWLKRTPNFRINDVVLIKDERLPPNRWPLGRIMKVHPGQDGLVRVVTLRTQDGSLKRPITKLCLLPITDNQNDHHTEPSQ